MPRGVCEPTPDLSHVDEMSWQEAHRRLRIMAELSRKTPRTRADVAAAATQLGCSTPQAYVLLRRYDADPTVTGLLFRRPGQVVGSSRLLPELDSVIDEAIRAVYLTRQKMRLADLVQDILHRCRKLGLPPPGRKAISARVRRIPPEQVVENREGRRAARERFASSTGRLEASQPLDLVQIDHTLVDVIVVDSHSRQPIQRPWLTVAIDVHTRCVMGLHLSLEAPSATSVALCLSHAVLPKDASLSSRKIDASWPISGVMGKLHLDNGKEFKSQALRRGCQQYGIEITYRPVRVPHYGGHIERLIGTLMGKVHLLPGTTFSSVQAKGNVDPEKNAAMTLDEVERWLGLAIAAVYHRETHRGIGTTPLAAWEQRAGITQASRSPADPRRFLIDFLPMERRQVRREGVLLHSIAYWNDVLRERVGRPEPDIVRYDPRDLSRIYWLAPDGNYYDLPYADVRRPPITLWEHRAARKRLHEQGRRQVDENAIFDAIEAMHQIATEAKVETKSLRRLRERRRGADRGFKAPEADPIARSSTAEPDPDNSPQSLLDVEEWS